MEHLKLIHKYLEQKASLDTLPSSGHPFVTISRQACAGGHLLAHVFTTDLIKEENQELFGGWHVFDRELCEVIAEDPELHTTVEALLAEHQDSTWRDFLGGILAGHSQQYDLTKRTFFIVRMLALLGKVVIVGRAGALVTRDFPNGVHIRLVSPEAVRTRWMMKKLKLPKGEALKAVRQQDADSHSLGKVFFDTDIGDPLLYDAVYNTERVEPHQISHGLIDLIKHQQEKKKTARE